MSQVPSLRILVVGDRRAETFSLPPGGDVHIGTGPTCLIRVDDPSVAERHAAIYLDPPVTLVDLGTGQPTRVGREVLEPGGSRQVAPGVVFAVGNVRMVVQHAGASARLRHVRSHAYLEARLEDECARLDAGGGRLALARFRMVSGNEGVLERALDRHLGASDILARYGPREYDVLFVGARHEEAHHVAEAVCESVVSAAQLTDDTDVEVEIVRYPRDARSAEGLVAAVSRYRDARVPFVSDDELSTHPLGDILGRIAANASVVLVVGERGSGKSTVAATIHRLSTLATKPLRVLRCGSMNELELEPHLFASLDAAEEATVVLAEIESVPIALQTRLARALEQARSRPRVIATTSEDLAGRVRRGAFLRDLLVQLEGCTVSVPPLRERLGDIESLANRFIDDAWVHERRRRRPTLAPSAVGLLTDYAWPGNVRELRNMIERAVLLCNDAVLDARWFPTDRMGRTLA